MEHTPEPSTIVFPGTDDPASPWRLYNHLIAGIPEDIFVRDYCLGLNWSYVEADCGCGVAYTARKAESARTRAICAGSRCAKWPSCRNHGASRRPHLASRP